jgi:hypothetical protein
MAIYLGNPGRQAALSAVLKGYTTEPVIANTVTATIGGGQVVARSAGPGRRSLSLAWTWLSPEEGSVLEEFFLSARGPGPYALLDPSRRNHLTANQSSATTVVGDASGHTVDPSEALTSTPDSWLRGPRALRWSLPATVTSGVLAWNPPAGLIGIPCPAGQPWTLSCWCWLTGLVASLTVTPYLSWRGLDGTELAATAGTPVVLTAGGAWQQLTVSLGAPPAGAVALCPQLRVTPGVLSTSAPGQDLVEALRPAQTLRGPRRPITGVPTLIASQTSTRFGQPNPYLLDQAPVDVAAVVVDQAQLEMYSSARTWVVGTGVPRVSLLTLPSTIRTLPARDFVLKLAEVG